jgi:ubiquinone/menaquinone biosynthesis C-methylase UbiE
MEEQDFKEIARQLRKPDGAFGHEIGIKMNESNLLMNKFAIETISPSKNDKILEIGMGNGFFVNDILSKDPSIQYTGVDFSDLMVKEAEKINSEPVSNKKAAFVQADAANMPFKDNSFNKIFTVNTLYFWDDPKSIFKEIVRVIQPDGKFFLVFRPKDSMEQMPFTQFGFNMYPVEDAEALLQENNFTIFDNKSLKEPVLPGDAEFGIKEYSGEVVILIAQPGK